MNMTDLQQLQTLYNQYIVIDDHGYDGNNINGIIDLTDRGICVRQLCLMSSMEGL